MKVKGSQVGWVFWLQWVLASTVGMFVGLIIAFLIIGNVLENLGNLPSNLLGGIGLGIGLGVLQWLVLRGQVSGVGWWILASAAGGYGIIKGWPEGYYWSSFAMVLDWTVVVALGGAVTGILQWLVLRGQVSRAGWWVLASTVGYGLGVTVARAFPWGYDFLDGIGALVVTAAVLGAVTGGALVWLLRQPVPEA
jgi:hypothetical protein